MTDSNKIAFIVCADDDREFEEAEYYINRLDVPAGITVEVVTTAKSHCIAAAFNYGMKQTDAKYKVYLADGVFILNSVYIFDILSIFKNDQIGMVGISGVMQVPPNAVIAEGERVGARFQQDSFSVAGFVHNQNQRENTYTFVEAVDGLCIATQYDIPWREDLFEGDDFLDLSQSFEFRKKGYEVVVPHQEVPWCLFDSHKSGKLEFYISRKAFLTEYRDMISPIIDPEGLIAVQMCTHNHPDIVREILEQSADDYKECGVDIYYFDSSTNDETERIVKEYIAKGYDNLYYVSVPEMEVHDKIDKFFAGEYLIKHYRYYWPSKDRYSLKRKALEDVVYAASRGYDAIFVLGAKMIKSEYDSPLELYRDYGLWVTSVNTTLYNSETLLKGFEGKTFDVDRSNHMFHFSHFNYFFERILLCAPKIKAVDVSGNEVMLFVEKADSVDFVKVWKDRWIEANDALPDYYNQYKDYVIKSAQNLDFMLGNRSKLVELYTNGVLTEENLPLFFDKWERLSDVPKEVLKSIAKGGYDIRYDLSIVKGKSPIINKFAEFAEKIRKGCLVQGNLPFETIALDLTNEIQNSPWYDGKKKIVAGAVQSILRELQCIQYQPEDVARHLQQLLAYFL